jgi:hypothetical protein
MKMRLPDCKICVIRATDGPQQRHRRSYVCTSLKNHLLSSDPSVHALKLLLQIMLPPSNKNQTKKKRLETKRALWLAIAMGFSYTQITGILPVSRSHISKMSKEAPDGTYN